MPTVGVCSDFRFFARFVLNFWNEALLTAQKSLRFGNVFISWWILCSENVKFAQTKVWRTFSFVFVSVEILSLRRGTNVTTRGSSRRETVLWGPRDWWERRTRPPGGLKDGVRHANKLPNPHRCRMHCNAGHGQVKREDKLSPRPRWMHVWASYLDTLLIVSWS